MNATRAWVSACVAIGVSAGSIWAVNIETVLVGDAGNAGQLAGQYGDGGPAHICGAVGYEYRIGKYEVTAGQYTEFLNKVGGVDTYGLYNTGMSNTSYGSGITRTGDGTIGNPYTYSVASSHVNRPVNYVSYWDACRFSNWLNNGQPSGAQNASTTESGTYTLNGYNGTDGGTIQRNPGSKWAVTSEDEWYKAAYYKGGSTNAGYFSFPTSSDTPPGRDMADVSGNNANSNNMNAYTNPIDSPYCTTVVGEFQNSDSPYGTFDQGGNVREWNEVVVHRDSTYSSRGVRGGAFCDYDDDTLWSLGFSFGSYPTSEFDRIGFRVSEVPEPATIVMLALAGVGILRRRTRSGGCI